MFIIYVNGCYSKINTCSKCRLSNISDQLASNKLGLKNWVEEYGFDGGEYLMYQNFVMT